jgi:hypothetical protein
MSDAICVGEEQPGLPPIRTWQPAQEMVEGTILHHDHDNVLDIGELRSGFRLFLFFIFIVLSTQE